MHLSLTHCSVKVWVPSYINSHDVLVLMLKYVYGYIISTNASVSISDAVDNCEDDHMPMNCDAETQQEDPSVSDHNYASKSQLNLKPPTSDMRTQCVEPAPLYTTLLRNNHLCQLTGLILDAFHSVAEHLTTTYTISFQLHTGDQLLMTLMKLYLAERFDVSKPGVVINS